MRISLRDLLQSTGPISAAELALRAGARENTEDIAEFLDQLEQLKNAHVIDVTGPGAQDLSNLDLSGLRQTFVQLSRNALRKSLAS